MSARVLVVTAVVIAALAGCGAALPTATPYATPTSTSTSTSTSEPSAPGIPPSDGGVYPLLPATHPHVVLSCPLVSAVHYDLAAIPPDAVDGVFICTAEPWTPAPDGTPQLVQYVDRVDQGDIPTLLAAYALPDAQPTDDNCIMSLQDPLIVWLHVGEQIIPVYAPRDGCGFPNDVADDAYHAVGLHRLLVAREKETSD